MRLDANEAPSVSAQHKIGWTYHTDVGPITYDFQLNHRTEFLDIDSNNYPALGKTLSFDFGLPYQFSIGVVIVREYRVT
jgi:hypothetical protein